MNFRFFLSFCFLLIALHPSNVSAQFIQAEIGVDGLTCSACSRSVEMSIRKLNFVQDVKMNLDSTNGIVLFKKSSNVEIEKVARAVFNAGYSVRYLKAVFIFNDIPVADNDITHAENFYFYFLKSSVKVLKGKITMTFVGPKFMEKKSFSEWKSEIDKKKLPKENVYFVIA
ncbi:MAG: heavy metal-associated domain-containing protein [Bacteroidota bacterium]